MRTSQWMSSFPIALSFPPGVLLHTDDAAGRVEIGTEVILRVRCQQALRQPRINSSTSLYQAHTSY